MKSPQISDLRDAFSGKLFHSSDAMAPYLTDWRGMWTGNALAVAMPETTADVARVVAWCASQNVAVVPQGGNTGLCGGATPLKTGHNLVLRLDALRAVRSLAQHADAMTVEAGITLAEAQSRAEAAGKLFPLSLAAEGTAQVGGILSTNAGGTHVFRYGSARDLCLGLEVVLPDGTVWDDTGAPIKDNTGYAIRHLFMGAEGTLGVITAASLRLFPKAAGAVAVLVAVDGIASAASVYHHAREVLGPELTACEMFTQPCLEAVIHHIPAARDPFSSRYPAYVLLEVASWQSDEQARSRALAVAEKLFEGGMIVDAAISESIGQFQALWALREHISEAQSAGRPIIKHDIALPLSKLVEFSDRCEAAIARCFPQCRVESFGHLGDGNLHFNIAPAGTIDKQTFLALTEPLNLLVHDMANDFGGSISAEHGLGVLRRDEAQRYMPAAKIDLMRRIKQAIDPNNIMNPNKVLLSQAAGDSAGIAKECQ